MTAAKHNHADSSVHKPDRSDTLVLIGLLVAYLLLIVLSIVFFRFGRVTASGNEMSLSRAVFTALNSASLTGFQHSASITNAMSPMRSGQIVVLILILAGTFFSMTAGGIAVARIIRLPYSQRQIFFAAAGWIAMTVLTGASVLIDRERGIFAALFQASSAFSNSGLFVGKLPGNLDWQTYAVLLPLVVLGGLGLPVLMQLLDRIMFRRPLSQHSWTVLVATAGIYLIGFLLLMLLRLPPERNDWSHWRGIIASSAVLSLNTRTAGFPIEYASSLPRAIPWLLMLLMMIGGSPAGTAGGLKTTTLAELFRGVGRSLRNAPAGRGFGVAMAWTASYLLLVLVGFLILLANVPEWSAERLLFLSISAASNVGLSHDAVSMNATGLYVLSAMMLGGRLIPILVLWWMAATTQDADLAIG